LGDALDADAAASQSWAYRRRRSVRRPSGIKKLSYKVDASAYKVGFLTSPTGDRLSLDDLPAHISYRVEDLFNRLTQLVKRRRRTRFVHFVSDFTLSVLTVLKDERFIYDFRIWDVPAPRISDKGMAVDSKVPFRVTKNNYDIAQRLLRGEKLDLDDPATVAVSARNRHSYKAAEIFVNYYHGHAPFQEIRMLSTPGKREYVSANKIRALADRDQQQSVFIVTTPRGVMTQYEAARQNHGGELVAEVRAVESK